jgi:hypothetical protein
MEIGISAMVNLMEKIVSKQNSWMCLEVI